MKLQERMKFDARVRKTSAMENLIKAMFTPTPNDQLDHDAKVAKRRRVSADFGNMIQHDKARRRERRAAKNAS